MEPQQTGRRLTTDGSKEFVAWYDEHGESLPELPRGWLKPMRDFLSANPSTKTLTRSQSMMLLRAMGLIASSEKRSSGRSFGSTPQGASCASDDKRSSLEDRRDRSVRLGQWHDDLRARHDNTAQRLEEKLAKMPEEETRGNEPHNDIESQKVTVDIPLEQVELTQEQKAASRARAIEFADHLELGHSIDPTLESVNETLMPGGSVINNETSVSLPVELPKDLTETTVVKTLHDKRVRYDFSVAVTRIELDVEKKVVTDSQGHRKVFSASTAEYGPPRFAVTWSALATLAVMVGQFAMPFNRLAKMLSTPVKRFTAASLSRMLHYVAKHFLPIYLELAVQMADGDIMSGDDTSSRVVEVSSYFKRMESGEASTEISKKPPWADYATSEAAERSLRRCEIKRKARLKQRADGDREAKRTPDEDPSLGVLIGRVLPFESPRRNGDGPKQALNTTVITARSCPEDPQSLIAFYHTHLGSFGNVLEAILAHRNPEAKDVFVQADLSTTNLVTRPDLLSRFDFHLVGCSSHARRPFALYEHEDPVYCSYMLHLFKGLAIHEQQLDVYGRNRENVLAVRRNESRSIWDNIKKLAYMMEKKWTKATKLGVAARYIIRHFDKLTAYLDDPRLEPTNNLRERMLRTERIIENNSMFRRSLEGRFVLDVIRTILQTAVAAGVPIQDYLVSVLRADPNEVNKHPQRFTPRAWALQHEDASEQP